MEINISGINMGSPSMFWEGKKYHLEDMQFSELVKAYIQYPAIQVYFFITITAAAPFSFHQQNKLCTPFRFPAQRQKSCRSFILVNGVIKINIPI